ncbi:unnamed protein product [Ectocarpus sp. 12 AP-2014]
MCSTWRDYYLVLYKEHRSPSASMITPSSFCSMRTTWLFFNRHQQCECQTNRTESNKNIHSSPSFLLPANTSSRDATTTRQNTKKKRASTRFSSPKPTPESFHLVPSSERPALRPVQFHLGTASPPIQSK